MDLNELIGDSQLESDLFKLNIDFGTIVAAIAILAPQLLHYQCRRQDGCCAKHPHIRRKKPGESLGWQEGQYLYLDSNNYPNSQMKAAMKVWYGIVPKGYETCHVWENTCYNTNYHTVYANLVLLPRAIASLSDHSPSIQKILQFRAYEIFGWKPDEESIPERPNGYPANWKTLQLKRQKTKHIEISKENRRGEEKIGAFAQRVLREYFSTHKIDDKMLDSLLSPRYYHQEFQGHSLSISLLSSIKNTKRYYSDPVIISGRNYYLTNDWYEDQRQALLSWLNLHEILDE